MNFKLPIIAFLFAALAMPLFAVDPALQFLGNTNQYLTGVGQLPARNSFIESIQSVSITTQTYPIASGQSVYLVYTKDNWVHSATVLMNFDYNVGNNSQWWAVIAGVPENTDIQYYITAVGPANQPLTDNNGSQNFEFFVRISPPYDTSAILQWFETDYQTIMKRLPDVVAAGYGMIYLPPPGKSNSGFSSGYNACDRFDLGDRLQYGQLGTHYGTTQDLENLVKLAHRFGVQVMVDGVLNHNDNRGNTPITNYASMIPEDFHIHSTVDTSNQDMDLNNVQPFAYNTLNNDLSGLVDIAQEDGNNAKTGVFTLPSYAAMNSWGKPWFVRHALTPQYYPNNAVVQEDVRDMLVRWGWFMENQVGVDGFRLDAVKHIVPGFLGGPETGGPGGNTHNGQWVAKTHEANPKGHAYIFGEDYGSDGVEMRTYLKGGENLFDFPLKFNCDSLFNSNGFGSLATSLSNNLGVDGTTGVQYEHGGLSRYTGVRFVQSHDQGPPTSNNLDYAFILTTTGRPSVYFEGNNVTQGNYSLFPKPGRADALGSVDSILLPILDTHSRYVRGEMVNRYTSTNLYIYERQVNGKGVLLVGLNNRGDQTNLSATVATAFAAGTVLTDLSGQMPDITVSATGTAAVTVPNNYGNNDNNGRGYVLYAEKAPQALSGITPVQLIDPITNLALTPATYTMPKGSKVTTATTFNAPTVTGNSINLLVTTDNTAYTTAVKLDSGLPTAGQTPQTNTPEGLTDGFVFASTPSGGIASLNNIDVSGLDNGLHLLKVRVFKNTGSRPGVFSEFNQFFYLNKPIKGPTMNGDLTDLTNVVATQTRTPSSQSNRLDEMIMDNDDQNLNIGLAGTVDASSSFMNGIALFLDTTYGIGSQGVNNFSLINDDSGPATRLLSNSNVSGPNGFGAKFALGVFRQNILHSSPEAPFIGGMAVAPPIGAQAGFYQIGSNLSVLQPKPVRMSFSPRSSPFGPLVGLKVAIPLSTLYPNGYTSKQFIGALAYLTTTGEVGTILSPSDLNRAALGGHPASVGYVSNQFLPAQSNVTTAPGTTPITVTTIAKYVLRAAQVDHTRLRIHTTAPVATGTPGHYLQSFMVSNISAGAVSAPLALTFVGLPSTVHVVNQTGTTFTAPAGLPYYMFKSVGTIPAGRTERFTIEFTAPSAGAITYSLKITTGNGIR